MTRPTDRSINLPIYLTDATSRNVMGQVHLPTYTYIYIYGYIVYGSAEKDYVVPHRVSCP